MNDISDYWDLRIVRTWRCSICGFEHSEQQGLRYQYTEQKFPYVPERWSLIKGELVCPKHKITADTLDGGTIQWIPGQLFRQKAT